MPGDSVGSACPAKLEVKKGELFYCFFKSNIPCFVRVHDFLQKLFLTAHASKYCFFRNTGKGEFLNLEIWSFQARTGYG